MAEETDKTKKKAITFGIVIGVILFVILLLSTIFDVISLLAFFIAFGIMVIIISIPIMVWWFAERKKKTIEIKEKKELSDVEILQYIFDCARFYWKEPDPKNMEVTHVSVGSPPTHLVYSIFYDIWDERLLPIAIIMDTQDKRKSIVLSEIGGKIKSFDEFIEEVMFKINQMAKRPTLVGIRKLKTYKPDTGAVIEESEEIPAEKASAEKEKEKEESAKSI